MDTQQVVSAQAVMEKLERARQMRAELEAQLEALDAWQAQAVAEARQAGLSWAAVAEPLAISAQAAHKRYASAEREPQPGVLGGWSELEAQREGAELPHLRMVAPPTPGAAEIRARLR